MNWALCLKGAMFTFCPHKSKCSCRNKQRRYVLLFLHNGRDCSSIKVEGDNGENETCIMELSRWDMHPVFHLLMHLGHMLLERPTEGLTFPFVHFTFLPVCFNLHSFSASMFTVKSGYAGTTMFTLTGHADFTNLCLCALLCKLVALKSNWRTCC